LLSIAHGPAIRTKGFKLLISKFLISTDLF